MSDPNYWEKDHGFDADGYQRKAACLGVAVCPACGKDVELVAETEVWVEKDGRKVHSGYGPAQGVCCDILVVDSWDGCEAYDLGDGPDEENSTAEMSETPGSDGEKTSSKIDISAHDPGDRLDTCGECGRELARRAMRQVTASGIFLCARCYDEDPLRGDDGLWIDDDDDEDDTDEWEDRWEGDPE